MRKILLTLAALCSLGPLRAQSPTEDSLLRRQVGQMIIAGFRGFDASATGPNTIAHAVKELGVGGVIYFDRDVPTGTNNRNIQSPAQLRALSAQLQALADTPLLITIDQEGGKVSRLKERYGFPATVSASYLGTQNDPAVTASWAARTAEQCARAGINVDFAPCTDVNVNPQCPVIGAIGRSFSADTAIVTAQAQAWITELHKRNVLTSLKHFPGHGSSKADSHLGLVDITDTWQRERELAPYRALIADGYSDFVMVGHLLHRSIDPEYPASLSRRWITDVLRRELGYRGVVITDDMNMGAIVGHYTLEKALEQSINAGVDMIILGNNGPVYEKDLIPRAIGLICGLVNSGRIPRERIEEAYWRIMETKERIR